MSLKLGNTTINKLYLGSTEINKVYLGSDLVYTGIQLPLANLVTYFKLNGNTNDATGTVTPSSNGIT